MLACPGERAADWVCCRPLLKANDERGAAGSDVNTERLKLLERMHQQQKQVLCVLALFKNKNFYHALVQLTAK